LKTTGWLETRWSVAGLVGGPALFRPVPGRNRYAVASRTGSRIVLNENNCRQWVALPGEILLPKKNCHARRRAVRVTAGIVARRAPGASEK
jgi:hypothetical protein